MTSKHQKYFNIEKSNDENRIIKPWFNRMVQLEERNQQPDEEKEEYREWTREARRRQARDMWGVNGQRR